MDFVTDIFSRIDSPVGWAVAAIVFIVVVSLLRQVISFLFLILALALGGYAVARYFDYPIPFVLPGMADKASAPSGGATAFTESLSTGGAPVMAMRSFGPDEAAAGVMAEGLRAARIVYNAPQTMTLNMPVDLRLLVDASDMENLEALLEGLEGETRTGEAALTSQVSASLYGSGFDIRALKPARQVLPDDKPISWQWEVTPRREGVRTLNLEVFAHPGDGDATAGVKEFHDQIDVTVTPLSRALAIAQDAHPVIGGAAAGVSLLAAFWGFARRRRKR